MIYSKTCEYAVRSLAYLATKPKDAKTRVPEVGRATGVPGPYVAKIFQCLVATGILRSYRGAQGGFSFIKDPQSVSVMEVIQSIDAMTPWNDCVMGLDQCSDANACPMHPIWKQAREKMLRKFKETNFMTLSQESHQHKIPWTSAKAFESLIGGCMLSVEAKTRFHIILIKPSKYDDDGYVIRWWRGVITSNSLACLYALSKQACAEGALGDGVEPVIHCLDETVQKVSVSQLCRRYQKANDRALVCLVGVQTNEYARALDLALQFKAEGIPSIIGGFHVSGCLEMLPTHPPEIQEAIDNGITLVGGEIENRWGALLKDAYENRLEPVYNFVHNKPCLSGAAGPLLPKETTDCFLNRQISFDAGRGCPFHCSFCTIINIQGNTMRGRDTGDIEALVRRNFESGGKHIFITDDNFARHKDWETIADRLIGLKENHGVRCSLMIQTDTVAHKIPRFIEKMTRAGVRRVFIGMESVNPANLKASGKFHNQLKEYRKMLQAWRDHGALTYAGYTLGFPGDTYESIMRDVTFLKNEIPLDLAEFFILTPLPGSKDHQKYYLEKIPLEPDTNCYDTMHVCMPHPNMTRDELLRAYHDAWKPFYSKEHILTLLLRRKGPRRRLLFSSLIWFYASIFLDRTHPLLSGFFRVKERKNRRRGMPVEAFIPFYAKRARDLAAYTGGLLKGLLDLWLLFRKAGHAKNQDYRDIATTVELPSPDVIDLTETMEEAVCNARQR